MEEITNMSEVVSEVKNATEDEPKAVIGKWFDKTRTDGMHLGAYYVSAGVYSAIKKNLKNGVNSSLRDYQRAIKKIMEIVYVQLKETQQNEARQTGEDEV